MEYGAIDLQTKYSQVRIVTTEGTGVFERRAVTPPDQFTTELDQPLR